MKLLALTFRRPSGSTFTTNAELSEAHAHDAEYLARMRARAEGRHSDDVLESWAVVDSTAVRVASPRNTKVAERHDLTDTDPDGRDLKVGVQHADAVGGEAVGGEAITGDGTGEPLPPIDTETPEGGAEVVAAGPGGEPLPEAEDDGPVNLDDIGSEPDGPSGRKPRRK